jgi:endonuclease/exonuclease/phosphatase family metal-dependent hydrolase
VTYRILSYNIQRGGRGREVQLAAVVNGCQPDLVVLQEARDPEVIRKLAADTGMSQWAARGGESLGFMSRTPLAGYAWHKPRISRHAFLEIHPAGTQARIFGVHLSAVHAAWTESRRIVELRALLTSIAKHQEGFHVLTGDFNTLAPGELLDFKKLPTRLRALVWLSGGKVRWRTIQVVLDGGYADAYRSTHGEAPGYTFPTWDPHVRLDYLFIPARLRQQLVSCEIVDTPAARAASDHLPLLSVVGIPLGQATVIARPPEPMDVEPDVHP